MSTIRSEISVKSPYYISKYRYLELKNFCFQYPEWRRKLKLLNWYGQAGDGRGSDISKPVERQVVVREKLLNSMRMIEQSAIEADPDIFDWIIKGVTEGVSYSDLRLSGLPCSKDYYYDRYRRFFWCLDQVRG